ncbi:hypothetical protein [Pyrobaculum aerophilum]|uniref:Uncharacterized protein n=2 Tax=Pyrobaculum aerophilum TaxID=13773 RepID=Q8ZYJ3_PYRAE|nr:MULTISPECIES: hypothetical protein [Pyrobaculum]AAL63000.1 hypothetical protein PAE0746 [Pyrobaculum aerophilum str. IM2]MCX8136195.1 hypothetical protein [Pyrobaculum aerophilum]HII48229.1 hypothetical protein [Pyrobaculum aerophilum]
MYLQILELSLLAVAVGVLALIILFIARRQQPLPPDVGISYTPGEQEIIKQIGELRERLDKVIPPYGRVGYIPSSIEELKDLLGFTYVKVGEKELGERPPDVDTYEGLDVELLQASRNGIYIYVIRRGGKKLVAAGTQYLDYLTIRFLSEFLDYL